MTPAEFKDRLATWMDMPSHRGFDSTHTGGAITEEAPASIAHDRLPLAFSPQRNLLTPNDIAAAAGAAIAQANAMIPSLQQQQPQQLLSPAELATAYEPIQRPRAQSPGTRYERTVSEGNAQSIEQQIR